MLRYLLGLVITPVVAPLVVIAVAKVHYLVLGENVWDYASFADPRFHIALALATFALLAITTPIAFLFRRRLGQRFAHYVAYGAGIGAVLYAALLLRYGWGAGRTGDALPIVLLLTLGAAGIAGTFWVLCVWRNPWWHRRPGA